MTWRRGRNFLDTGRPELAKSGAPVNQDYSQVVIIALEEQIQFVKIHIPHRIAILLAPFDRSADTPGPGSAIREAVLHGSFVAFRSLMDFMGLKDDRKSQSPSLITHNATNDDVNLASFGLPLLKVAELTESDADLLASVYRVTNKAVAHLTSNSGHPQILPQYYAACTLLHALLREHLLSRY